MAENPSYSVINVPIAILVKTVLTGCVVSHRIIINTLNSFCPDT